MNVLTLLDVLRIQQFVFSSNKLRDVVAGSELVREATDADTLERLPGSPGVVYSAGGNALLRFATLDAAKTWTEAYSLLLLREYPGLEVAVEHRELETGVNVATAYQNAIERLARTKLRVRMNGRLDGLSVTAECAETREVATHRLADRESGRDIPLSSGMARRRAAHLSQKGGDWARFVPRCPHSGKEFAFPLQLDHMGRTWGDTSLLAVVHIDANRIGNRVRSLVRESQERGDSLEAFAESVRGFSSGLSAAMAAAMRSVIERVVAATVLDDEGQVRLYSKRSEGGFELKSDSDIIWLPFRPLVLGGDDLTFVCDGRIGLDLAAHALEALSEQVVHGGVLSACAGVAIARTHSPFSRACALATELAKGAKLRYSERPEVSAIDWHIGDAASFEGVRSLRQRVYQSGVRKFTMRPYSIGASARLGTFRWLDREVLGSRTTESGGFLGAQWQRSRNKLKAMRDVVRGGSEAVKGAMATWAITAEVPDLPGGLQSTDGFVGNDTPLLDALELMDVFLPLGGEEQ
jgi:hypothetical protein